MPMVPSRPSRTAEAVAFMRALDHLRPAADRVVDDPFAAWFLGKLGRAHLASPVRAVFLPALVTYVQARHRYMDDTLRVALPGVEQVVILGAGYDMRAWRFASAVGSRPVFEVDYPSTQRRKERILGDRPSPVDLRRVSIDFETQTLPEVLGAAGFRPGAPTFFVWEGVSMYLTRAAVKSTLLSLAALGGPGSGLTMDFWQLLDSPDLVATARRVSAGLLSLLGEPLTFALHPEEVGDFLRRLGWRVSDTADAQVLRQRYLRDGRGIYPACFVVTAVRS